MVLDLLGGRRCILNSLENRAIEGQLLSAKQLLPEVSRQWAMRFPWDMFMTS